MELAGPSVPLVVAVAAASQGAQRTAALFAETFSAYEIFFFVVMLALMYLWQDEQEEHGR